VAGKKYDDRPTGGPVLDGSATSSLEVGWTEMRLALLGILATMSLGAASIAASLCCGWAAAVAGGGTFLVTHVLLRRKPIRTWLAQRADVLTR
jgi:hypothetical protein